MIGADAGNGIRVFIPDIGMFVAGLAIWLLCRSLVQKRPPEDMAQYNADFEAEEQVGFFVLTRNVPKTVSGFYFYLSIYLSVSLSMIYLSLLKKLYLK